MSFTAGTRVLLASGAATAISSLKPGDMVLATSTKTSKTSPEAVSAVKVNHDHDLYDLRVKAGRGTEVVHTTASHLFWDPSLDQWIPANRLKTGEHLKTPDGTLATAEGRGGPHGQPVAAASQPAAIGPHRQHVAHGPRISTSCSEDPFGPFGEMDRYIESNQ